MESDTCVSLSAFQMIADIDGKQSKSITHITMLDEELSSLTSEITKASNRLEEKKEWILSKKREICEIVEDISTASHRLETVHKSDKHLDDQISASVLHLASQKTGHKTRVMRLERFLQVTFLKENQAKALVKYRNINAEEHKVLNILEAIDNMNARIAQMSKESIEKCTDDHKIANDIEEPVSCDVSNFVGMKNECTSKSVEEKSQRLLSQTCTGSSSNTIPEGSTKTAGTPSTITSSKVNHNSRLAYSSDVVPSYKPAQHLENSLDQLKNHGKHSSQMQPECFKPSALVPVTLAPSAVQYFKEQNINHLSSANMEEKVFIGGGDEFMFNSSNASPESIQCSSTSFASFDNPSFVGTIEEASEIQMF